MVYILDTIKVLVELNQFTRKDWLHNKLWNEC